MKFSIIIVSFNTSEYVIKCVTSLTKLEIQSKYEIVIVDNNSNDYSNLTVLNNISNVKLVKSDVNNGFGSACNIGVKSSKGEFIVFINPDTSFSRDVFKDLLDFFEKNNKVGFLGGILLNENLEPTYSYNSFPGFHWEFLQAVGFGSNSEIKKLLSRKEVIEQSEPFEVDWLIGAFLFTSRKIINELNGFDERFFLYYEDVDIQYRAKLLGYKNYCLPYVSLYHFEKSSVQSDRGDDVYHFYMYKSKMMYYYLHFSFLKRNFLRVLLLIGLFLRMILLFIRKTFPNKKKKWKQYLYMLRYFTAAEKSVFENKRI